MKYTFGVMSNKWSIEAPDDNLAYVAMSIFIAKNIPIAVYSPKPKGFMPEEMLKNNEASVEQNIEKLKRCLASIKRTK